MDKINLQRKPLRALYIKLPKKEHERIKEYSIRTKKSITSIIRNLIKEFFK